MSILLQILGTIVSVLFGKIVEYMWQHALEQQAAKAGALQQYVESVKLSGDAQDKVDQAVQQAQAAQLQVVTLQEQLDAIKTWNTRMRNLGRKP